jgi:hypothetical protein
MRWPELLACQEYGKTRFEALKKNMAKGKLAPKRFKRLLSRFYKFAEEHSLREQEPMWFDQETGCHVMECHMPSHSRHSKFLAIKGMNAVGVIKRYGNLETFADNPSGLFFEERALRRGMIARQFDPRTQWYLTRDFDRWRESRLAEVRRETKRNERIKTQDALQDEQKRLTEVLKRTFPNCEEPLPTRKAALRFVVIDRALASWWKFRLFKKCGQTLDHLGKPAPRYSVRVWRGTMGNLHKKDYARIETDSIDNIVQFLRANAYLGFERVHARDLDFEKYEHERLSELREKRRCRKWAKRRAERIAAMRQRQEEKWHGTRDFANSQLAALGIVTF